MYIEDILDHLVGIYGSLGKGQATFFSSNDLKLLSSISSQLGMAYAISEKQANVVERILTNHISDISLFFSKDMASHITNPVYKTGKRKIDNSKTVKIITDSKGIKKISVSFPFNEALVNKIKLFRGEHQSNEILPGKRGINWEPVSKSWIFNLYEPFISWIRNTFSSEGFIFDEQFLEFSNKIKDIEEQVEKYVPMVTFNEGKFSYVNTHKNILQPSSTDLLEVLFESKKYGISVWDESIALALADDSISQLTNLFLNHQLTVSYSKCIEVNNATVDFFEFDDILKYNGVAMIIIPNGDEYFNLTKSHEELKKMGFKDEEMCVLFRTDNSTSSNTNDFIKEHNLNNPISENIKIYFTSLKFPKPLIAKKIKIGTIINLGASNAHHTMRTFVKNHHNVLNYKIKKQ